jgi:hypothetical protein
VSYAVEASETCARLHLNYLLLLFSYNQNLNVLTNFTKPSDTKFSIAVLGLHYVGRQAGMVVLKGIFLKHFIVNMSKRNAALLK